MTKDKKKMSLNQTEEPEIETSTVESNSKQHSYEDRLLFLNAIAKPLASRKLTKKIYKLIKKAHKDGSQFWSGLKTVQQKIRKGGTGIVILAGDVNPIDVYSHLPIVCEENELPYVFVPSREDIGLAMGVTRAVVCVFIGEAESYSESYQEIRDEIKTLPLPI